MPSCETVFKETQHELFPWVVILSEQEVSTAVIRDSAGVPRSPPLVLFTTQSIALPVVRDPLVRNY